MAACRMTMTVLSILLAVAGPARAVPTGLLERYAAAAKSSDPGFSGFDAARGKALYSATARASDGTSVSCTSCHTSDPRQIGKTKVGKAIEPLAPSANPKRLTNEAKIEKWLKRNCNDVLERECTPLEKGDFLTYLESVK